MLNFYFCLLVGIVFLWARSPLPACPRSPLSLNSYFSLLMVPKIVWKLDLYAELSRLLTDRRCADMLLTDYFYLSASKLLGWLLFRSKLNYLGNISRFIDEYYPPLLKSFYDVIRVSVFFWRGYFGKYCSIILRSYNFFIYLYLRTKAFIIFYLTDTKSRYLSSNNFCTKILYCSIYFSIFSINYQLF